jgi:hypothetical protein
LLHRKEGEACITANCGLNSQCPWAANTVVAIAAEANIRSNQYRSEGLEPAVDLLALLLEVEHKPQPVVEKLLEVRAWRHAADGDVGLAGSG